MKVSTIYELVEIEVIGAWPEQAASRVKACPTDDNRCGMQDKLSALILKFFDLAIATSFTVGSFRVAPASGFNQ